MELIADIGATQTRCALIDPAGRILGPEIFRNRDFDSLHTLLHGYLDRRRDSRRPEGGALAVAAPVLSDRVRMPNIDWRFSQNGLKDDLDLRRLIVVNDFAAVAWGLSELTAADLKKIGGGAAVPRTAMATLGPGSGLGVAAAAPCADGWTVVEGEGGNITFSGFTSAQQAVAERIRAEHGHCSAENFLSGPGLVNIYTALGALQGRRDARATSPAQISESAAAGDALACSARDMFFEVLGATAGNLALTVGARGGVFIAGGIVPRLLEPFANSRFRECFETKGRYRGYLEAIPTFVITDPFPAFRGLRKLLEYR